MATYVYTPTRNADGTWSTTETVRNGSTSGASAGTTSVPSYSTPTGGSFTSTNSSGNSVSGNYGTGMNDWSSQGTGATGKTYATSNNNQSIYVARPDGTTSVVNKGDPNYNATENAMKTDLGGAGINYNPTYTTTVHRDVKENANGGYDIDYSKPQTFTTQAYLPGNEALQKAFTEAGKQQLGISLNDYVKSLYDSVGTEGGYANKDSLNAGLGALGLTDFDTEHALYSAGGNIIPGGNAKQFGELDDTAGNNILVNGKPQGGMYYNYGGQSYLMNGDAANLAQFANGQTGNWTASDYILGNLTANPMVQGDQNLNQLAQAGTNYYNNLGFGQNANGTQTDANGVIQPGTVNPNGTVNYTGNSKVDSTINYVGNVLDYAIQTGDSDLYAQVAAILSQGLKYQQEFLDKQRDRAESKASDQKSAAWVSNQIAARNLKQQLAAQGLGTTGALVGGMVGLQNSYNNAIGQINDGLIEMLSNLDSEELKLLSDHFNNLGQYKYQIGSADLDRALQREKMAQDQANADRDFEFRVNQDTYNREQDALNREENQQNILTKEQQQKFDNAYKMLSAGIATQEVADALGITLAEAQQYAAQLTTKKSSGDGGDKNPSPSPAPTPGVDFETTAPYDYFNQILGPADAASYLDPNFRTKSVPFTYEDDYGNEYESAITTDAKGRPITFANLYAGLYDPFLKDKK